MLPSSSYTAHLEDRHAEILGTVMGINSAEAKKGIHADSQLLDERRFAVEEVARIFRVPMFMLGVTTPGAVSYASVEQQMLFFSQHTIQPYVQKLETAFSTLLQNPQTFIRFNLSLFTPVASLQAIFMPTLRHGNYEKISLSAEALA